MTDRLFTPNEKLLAFAEIMQEDLKNEFKHLHFYLHSGVMIQGLHRQELGEFFLEEAQSELKHCEEFARKIRGLGAIPTTQVNLYPSELYKPADILGYIHEMESEVCHNFSERLNRLSLFDGFNHKPVVDALRVFYEDQLADSYKTVEHVSEMLRGLS